LAYTRAMIQAALEGKLSSVEFESDPIFGLAIPTSCPGAPAEILNPRNTWANPVEYDEAAKNLNARFVENSANIEQAIGEA